MTKQKLLHTTVRLLTMLSYMFCALQWFWLGILILGIFSENGFLDTLNRPEPVAAPIQNPAPASPVALAIGGVVTVTMIFITIFVLIRLPKAIAKTSQVVTERATQAVLPVVTHHKKLPKKKKLQLSAKLTFYIRLVLVALPFLVLFALPRTRSIQPNLVIFVGGFLAITTLTLITVESVLHLAMPVKKR